MSYPAKSEPDSPLARGDEFVRLFSRNEAKLHGYILTMVPNWADAADILQETSSVIWRKFDQFEKGTNFYAWACQIARLEVMAFRRRKRGGAVAFSDEFVSAVASKADELSELLEQRQHFLIDCMNKLRPRDRELLRQRYFEDSRVETVAQRTGRTVEAVYKALQRVRQQLFDCIERTSAQGGRP